VVVVAGDPDGAAAKALLSAALSAADPGVCVLRAPSAGALPPLHPAHGKTAPAGTALAYVCRGGACGLPVADAAALAAMLRCNIVAAG
jgi:uncharacterized protein YyaL (SSP411 family)